MDTSPLSVASTVTVLSVDIPPTLTVTVNNPTFTEGDSAAILYSSTVISTIVYGQTILELDLTVTNVTDGTNEILNIDGSSVALTNGNSVTTATNGMTAAVSLSGTTATVTISNTGGITPAAMQTLVNGIAYKNTSNNPTTNNRVATLTSIMGNGGTANGNSLITTPNGMNAPVSLTGTKANVTISKSGGITPAVVQPTVKGSTYQNININPTSNGKVVNLTSTRNKRGIASGGVDTSALSNASTVTVLAVNIPPALTANANNPTFTEGGSAATLYSSTAITTVKTGQTILQVVLTVTNVTDGTNEILNIDGSSVALTNGNSVTTATNGMTAAVSLSGSTATVTISKSGGITPAAMQTLVNGIAYKNTSINPGTNNRVVTLTSIQGSGGTANGGVDTSTLSITSTVTVISVNAPPTLTATANNPSYTEGGSAAILYSSTAITAVKTGQTILQIVLTVTNVTDGTNEILNIDGSSVALTNGNSVTTATNGMTATVSLSGSTATVTISKPGGITPAAMQTLVNGIAYKNTSNNPTTNNRIVTLTSIQGSGGTANGGVNTSPLSITSSIIIYLINNPPTLTAAANNPTFTEGGSAAILYLFNWNIYNRIRANYIKAGSNSNQCNRWYKRDIKYSRKQCGPYKQ